MRLSNLLPFAIGFVTGITIIAAWNWYSFATMYDPYLICFDCGRTAGAPFTMYNSGYIWGGEGYIASGVFANLCVVLILGAALGALSVVGTRLAQRGFRFNKFK